MQFIDILFLIIGLVVLVVGAEALVRGASRLALGLGVPALIVGLTIVAFGTSAPELTVSVYSAYNGIADVAIGNVVGSNIFNVLFILGISAMIVPLSVSSQLVKLDVPLMIASSLLMYLMAQNGVISRGNGMILFAMVVSYTTYLIFQAKKGRNIVVDIDIPEDANQKFSVLRCLAFIAVGVAGLILGSKMLIDGAVAIARYFEISELVIGLTIIAAGTSLPEVATSIMAAIRGERDIAVGNVVGSNIFNILSVVGLSAIVVPGGIPVNQAALSFDIPIMVAVAVACLPIFFTGASITRWEGTLLFGYYLVYTTFIVFTAMEHSALPTFSATVLFIALPLTSLVLGCSFFRAYKTGNNALRNGNQC